MLYTKIKHAGRIRKLYKLQNTMMHKRHREVGTRLGFQKYSRYYYELLEKLQKEKILDEKRVFIENTINLWIAELPRVLSEKEAGILGNKIPFLIYLDLFLNPIRKNARAIHDGLKITRSSTYYALEKLESQRLVERIGSEIIISERHGFFNWLTKYVELCLSHADVTKDVFVLFDLVPAYVDGSQAFYMLNYKPGRPIGTLDMIIRTNEPYMQFWKYVVDNVRYFTDYQKRITVLPIEANDEFVWIDEIPYNKNPREAFQ